MTSHLEPQFRDPHIKGSVVRSAKEWIIKTYGEELFHRALAAIPKEMRDTIQGEVLSVGWYPLTTWTTFMDSVRREVKRTTGEDADEFDRRNIFEAGKNTVIKVYRFVLGFFDPATAVDKILPVLRRIYSHGDIKLISHDPGRLVVRFDEAPLSMQTEVTKQFPLSCEFMLHVASQRVTNVRPTLRTEGSRFSLELEIQYKKA